MEKSCSFVCYANAFSKARPVCVRVSGLLAFYWFLYVHVYQWTELLYVIDLFLTIGLQYNYDYNITMKIKVLIPQTLVIVYCDKILCLGVAKQR